MGTLRPFRANLSGGCYLTAAAIPSTSRLRVKQVNFDLHSLELGETLLHVTTPSDSDHTQEEQTQVQEAKKMILTERTVTFLEFNKQTTYSKGQRVSTCHAFSWPGLIPHMVPLSPRGVIPERRASGKSLSSGRWSKD